MEKEKKGKTPWDDDAFIRTETKTEMQSSVEIGHGAEQVWEKQFSENLCIQGEEQLTVTNRLF